MIWTGLTDWGDWELYNRILVDDESFPEDDDEWIDERVWLEWAEAIAQREATWGDQQSRSNDTA